MRKGGKVAQLDVLVAGDAVGLPHRGEQLGLLDGVHTEVRLQVQVQVQHVLGIARLLRHQGQNPLADLALGDRGDRGGSLLDWGGLHRGALLRGGRHTTGPLHHEADHMRKGGKVAQLDVVVAGDAVGLPHRGEQLGLLDGVHTEVRLQVQVQVQHVLGIARLLRHQGQNPLADLARGDRGDRGGSLLHRRRALHRRRGLHRGGRHTTGPLHHEADHMRKGGKVAQLDVVVAGDAVGLPHRGEQLGLLDGVHTEVRERVLALVAEKTGYPQDMLDLDLDLEADLGVDTVKQAELFATVREAYGITRDDNVKLRDFPTLAHVIRFVMERAGGVPAATEESTPVEATPVEEAPAAVTAVAEGEVRERVLALVAEKTGYPQDMLDLDLDLEADLGVDTVKQAELFATVREAYGITRDDNVKLRDFPTLAHVIRFVMERAGGVPAATEESTPVVGPNVTAGLESCDIVTRRVPVPILRPPFDLCRPTGVQLHAGARVVVMPDQGGAGDALIRLLADRGVEVLVIDGASTAESLAGQLSAWAAAGDVQGVYWLPALDSEPPLTQLDIASWKEHLRIRVKLLATAMRSLYEQVASSGTFLVVGTRM